MGFQSKHLTSDTTSVILTTGAPPTIQKFLTGSGTYTRPNTPSIPLYLKVTMVGGGGGGGGISGGGSTGTASTFGGALLSAGGGFGGGPGNTGGGGNSGGVASLGTALGTALTGGSGLGGTASTTSATLGGAGGVTAFGGQAISNVGGGGGTAVENTGAGGNGGGGSAGVPAGGGGGAGGYVQAFIVSPASSYSYSVGTGGVGGTGGGSAGASGYIIVEEYYGEAGGGGGGGSGITALTGDIVASGSGSVISTYNGIVPIEKGGTGQITFNAGFNALSPMTVDGDLIIRNTGIAVRLGIGAVGQVLTVSAGGLPTWAAGGSGGSAPKIAYSRYTLNGVVVPTSPEPIDALHFSTETKNITQIVLAATNSGTNGNTLIRVFRDGISGPTSQDFLLPANGGRNSAAFVLTTPIPMVSGDYSWAEIVSVADGDTEEISVEEIYDNGSSGGGGGSGGITDLIGEVTATGPGSATATIATGIISNAKIATNAAISFSKLAPLLSGQILVGNVGAFATAVAMTGDISINNLGVTAYVGTVPITKGGTGAITNVTGFDALSPMTTLGDLITGGAGGSRVRLGIGGAGQILTVVGGVPAWATGSGGGGITALTGDVAASGTGTVSATIQPGAVDNSKIAAGAAISFSKLAALPSGQILVGNGSAPVAVPMTGAINITAAGATTYVGTVPITAGGTGAISKIPAFDALSPLTTAGDIIFFSGGSNTRLPIGTVAGQVLTVVGGTPAWATATGGGITQLTGDVTTPLGSGPQVATIAAGAVDNARLAASAVDNVKISAGAAIAFSKLAAIGSGQILVGSAGLAVTAVNMTGDISISNSGATAYTGTVPINKGGTGAITKPAGFDALSPMTANGDLIIRALGTGSPLPIGAVGQVLTVSAGLLPTWAASTGGSGITSLSGDVVATGPGAVSATIQPGAVDNGKISASAAISFSKLAALGSGQILVGNGSAATAVAMSGDISINSSGATTIAASAVDNAKVSATAAIAYSKLSLSNSIVNADISSGAAIAFSKLASLPSGQMLVGNGSGVVTALPIGTVGQVLTVAGGVPTWAASGGGGSSTGPVFSTTTHYQVEFTSGQTVWVKSASSGVQGLSWSRSTTTLTVTSTAHGRSVGDRVILRNFNEDYLVALVATVVDANNFTVTCNNTGGTSGTAGFYTLGFTFTHNAATGSITGGTLTAPSGGNVVLLTMRFYLLAASKTGSTYLLTLPASSTNGAGGDTGEDDLNVPFLSIRTQNSGSTSAMGALGSTLTKAISGNYNQFQLGGLGAGNINIQMSF